jgi:hypothetical protein
MQSKMLNEMTEDEIDRRWKQAVRSAYGVNIDPAPEPPLAEEIKCCCTNGGRPYFDKSLGFMVVSHNAGCRVAGHGSVSALGARNQLSTPNRGGQRGTGKRSDNDE